MVCVALFVLHPVGCQAYAYSFYWFVPPVVLLLSKSCGDNFDPFATAFTSTFLAHALGSLICLYTMPTSPLLWYLLIPVVAKERLLLGMGALGIHFCIALLAQNGFELSKRNERSLH